MSEFIQECRREWKRLHVPAPIADEMAADLTADLEAAEADGASLEDLLGSLAMDARTFAASLAHEKGVARPHRRHKVLRRPNLLAAASLVLALTAAGVTIGLTTASHHSPTPSVSVVDVRYIQEDQAAKLLKQRGLAVHVSVRRGSSQPSGTVIGETPAPGTLVSTGTVVSITVAQR